jgi:hypothetical protein
MSTFGVHHKSFESIIKNKRVIFVGPAPILIDKKLGSFIDSFDLVVRTNTFGYELPENKIDYGSRCDIVYFNNQFNKYLWPHDIKKLKSNGVKFIKFKGVGGRALVDMQRKINCGKANFQNLLEHGIKTPLMLPIIIDDITRHAPKMLHITGIDFYYGRHFDKSPDYLDCYRSEKFLEKFEKEKRDYPQNIELLQPRVNHDYFENTKYIEKMFSEKKIDMDNFTVDLMNKNLNYYKEAKNGLP